ncbi:MAG: hypothetical protein QXU52_01345 [Fervidicoccaceae archaeon]
MRPPLDVDEFAAKAVEMIEEARRRGVVLRILGACAVYLHSLHEPDAVELARSLGRFEAHNGTFKDVDLAAYGKQRKQVVELLERGLGLESNPLFKMMYGHKRLIYVHPTLGFEVDVFFDKLEFNHDVPFGEGPGRGRLELDYPTLPLADLLLSKLQIVRSTRGDLLDVAAILRAHELCEGEDRECVDSRYVVSILSDDWGFWYDAVTNLKRARELLESRGLEEARAAISRIDELLDVLERAPKTKRWVARSKVGTSRPWFREVEELER